MLIHIRILMPPEARFAKPVLCRIEIRDSSLMDVPAEIIAVKRDIINEISTAQTYKTEIEIPDELAKEKSFTVWGHISLSQSDKINPGDYVTTVSYTVAKNVFEDYILIEFKLVK